MARAVTSATLSPAFAGSQLAPASVLLKTAPPDVPAYRV
jgi:hypothetical protein